MRPVPALQGSQAEPAKQNDNESKERQVPSYHGAQGGVVRVPARVWEGNQGRLPGGGGAFAEFWLSWEVSEGILGSKGTEGSSAGVGAEKAHMVRCSDGTCCMKQGLGQHEAGALGSHGVC